MTKNNYVILIYLQVCFKFFKPFSTDVAAILSKTHGNELEMLEKNVVSSLNIFDM